MNERSEQLLAVARRVEAALPPSVCDVVLTGSTSRGVADQLSDVELLVISDAPPAKVPLEDVDRWTPPGLPINWIGGRFDGEFVELIWWPSAFVEERVAGIATGEIVDRGRIKTAEAIVNGISLRGSGHARWAGRLAGYPDGLADKIIDDAEATFRDTEAQILSVQRPGDALALAGKVLDYAEDLLRIVFAVNREWEPGWKRLAARLEPLDRKPERLAARLDKAVRTSDLDALRQLAEEALALR
jgi:hypothetical protein